MGQMSQLQNLTKSKISVTMESLGAIDGHIQSCVQASKVLFPTRGVQGTSKTLMTECHSPHIATEGLCSGTGTVASTL